MPFVTTTLVEIGIQLIRSNDVSTTSFRPLVPEKRTCKTLLEYPPTLRLLIKGAATKFTLVAFGPTLMVWAAG